MTQHLVLVSDSDQCTLEISTKNGAAVLATLEWAQGHIDAKRHDALAPGRQSIPLPSGVYHLAGVRDVTAWSITGGRCTVVTSQLDGEDPWPVPPAAWSNVNDQLFRAEVRRYLAEVPPVGL